MTKKIEKMFLKLLEFSIKSHTRKKRISRLSLYMTLRPEFEFVNVQGAQGSIPRFLGSLNVYKFGLSPFLSL